MAGLLSDVLDPELPQSGLLSLGLNLLQAGGNGQPTGAGLAGALQATRQQGLLERQQQQQQAEQQQRYQFLQGQQQLQGQQLRQNDQLFAQQTLAQQQKQQQLSAFQQMLPSLPPYIQTIAKADPETAFQLYKNVITEQQKPQKLGEGDVLIGADGKVIARNAKTFAPTAGQPTLQPFTAGDGTVYAFNNKTGGFAPAQGPDGQQIVGKVQGAPTATQIQNAEGKLQTVAVLRQQLQSLKDARQKLGGGSQGIGLGVLPTESGRNYDAALAALQPTVRALTRTPGEGSMSDFESRIASAQLPSRNDYASAIDLKIQQLDDLATTIEQGYTGYLANAPGRKRAPTQRPEITLRPGAGPPAASAPAGGRRYNPATGRLE